MLVRIAGAAVLLLTLLASMAQAAEKRVALVIGNSAYKHAGELLNPRNDAADIARALKALNFNVIEGTDLDRAAMERKLREFARALEGSDVGLFFYAGHGLQAKGVNYLLGIDANLEAERDLEFETLRLEAVLTHMEREAKTSIVFLDACRNNPLARNLARTMGTRGVNENSGLAPVAFALGTFVAFATQPGAVASDGSGRNSPFTAALKKHIAAPGLALNDVMIEVRKEVVGATNGAQVPWDHSALQGRFYFNITINVSPPQSAPPGPPLPTEAERAWSSIIDSKDIRDFEAFRRQYGKANTFYDAQAERRIDDLKKQAAAAKVQAEAEAKRRQDEQAAAKKAAADDAKQQAQAAAKKQAVQEAGAKAQAEAESKRKMDAAAAKKQAEQEAAARAQADAEANRKAERERRLVQQQVSAAATEWSRLDKTNIVELETFLRRHASSPEAEYARARLANLKQQQVVIATPPPAPAQPRGNDERAADAASRWGLLGTWRLDCTKPANPSNPDLKYVVRTGKLFHDREFTDGRDSSAVASVTTTTAASIVLVINFESLSKTAELSIIKGRDGRIRATSNRDIRTNEYTIKDGKFTANGNTTPWQSRCH